MRRIIAFAIVAIPLIIFIGYPAWHQYRFREGIRRWKCTDEPLTSWTNRMALVELNMTTEDVVRIAGPATIARTNSTERWLYSWMQLSPGFLMTVGVSAHCELVISNGVVVGKEINDNGRWGAVE